MSIDQRNRGCGHRSIPVRHRGNAYVALSSIGLLDDVTLKLGLKLLECLVKVPFDVLDLFKPL